MALVRHEHCRECAQRRLFVNGKCSACVDRKRQADLAAWLSQTDEAKLLDLHRRVQALEAKPHRY